MVTHIFFFLHFVKAFILYRRWILLLSELDASDCWTLFRMYVYIYDRFLTILYHRPSLLI